MKTRTLDYISISDLGITKDTVYLFKIGWDVVRLSLIVKNERWCTLVENQGGRVLDGVSKLLVRGPWRCEKLQGRMLYFVIIAFSVKGFWNFIPYYPPVPLWIFQYSLIISLTMFDFLFFLDLIHFLNNLQIFKDLIHFLNNLQFVYFLGLIHFINNFLFVFAFQTYVKIEIQEGRVNLRCPQCTEHMHPNGKTFFFNQNDFKTIEIDNDVFQ